MPSASKPQRQRAASKLTRLVASRRFQKWAARFPLTRRIVRSEGEAMFDLVAGFCHSQILQALVEFKIPDMLLQHELDADAIGRETDVPPDRLHVLLSGAVAIGILKKRQSGHYALTTRGAALAGVPGLSGMIAHHDVLYLDLADPVAFFRGEVETELAEFWPYVFGAKGANDPKIAAQYSALMADSQVLVADDTLSAISLKDVHRIMDVGGGTGAFLAAVAGAYPKIDMTLFDLPVVAPAAKARFEDIGLAGRLTIATGSFREDRLPENADLISLVRVLYDHSDETVRALLQSIYVALPKGGRVVVSEPMSGGAKPERAGDAYFAIYCMAMRTGKARSVAEISHLLSEAGFTEVQAPHARRPFITSVVTGVKPS